LQVAFGEPLPLAQDELAIHGHAFEARIYAEDPNRDFLPASGVLNYLEPPPESRHVRVDTGVLQGDEVSVHYDPMIAKLVTWDESRERALARMARALSKYRISGPATNLSFLYNLVTSEPFRAGAVDTHFIENHRDLLFHDTASDRIEDLPLASLYLLLRMEQESSARAGGTDPWSPWNASTAWRLNAPAWHTGAIVLNGTAYDVPVEEVGSGSRRRFRITAAGRTVLASGHLEGAELFADIDGYRQTITVVPDGEVFTLFSQRGSMQFSLARPDYGEAEAQSSDSLFSAPMHGSVVKLLVQAGVTVEEGQPLLILEAMKMEHTICAPSVGVVNAFHVTAGDQVAGGDQLLDFSAASDSAAES
jgi:3-methylcrotonyl-CoA carboxylase alpha subunit